MSFQEIQGNVIIYLFPYQQGNSKEYYLYLQAATYPEKEENFQNYLSLVNLVIKPNSDWITINYKLSIESKKNLAEKFKLSIEDISEFSKSELGELENIIKKTLGEDKFNENKKHLLDTISS